MFQTIKARLTAITVSVVVMAMAALSIANLAVTRTSMAGTVDADLKALHGLESDMIARMVDGETLALSGFTHDRETRERKSVGITGGWLGRATVVTRKRIELVILLTPRIVPGVAAQ